MSRRAPGEGSIWRRKDGRWQGRVVLEDGRRKDFYGETQQTVRVKVSSAVRARDSGQCVPGERQLVGAFLRDWLEVTRPAVRPSTWKRYSELLSLHAVPSLGRLPLSRLKPEHLDRLYAQKVTGGLSPRTVSHLHAVVHRALKYALLRNRVARNVADLVRPPQVARKEMATLSREQVRTLVAAASTDRFGALLVVALTTGLRQGELLALHWAQVDLDAASLSVIGTAHFTGHGRGIGPTKTASSRRRVKLAAPAVEALRRHRIAQTEQRLKLGSVWHDADLVFPNRVGRLLDPSTLGKAFHLLLVDAGLPRIRFHDLRHTAATLLLGEGVPAKVASEMLGHASIAITLDTYSHVTPAMQESAVSAMERVLADGL